jgi:hypothetical protein
MAYTGFEEFNVFHIHFILDIIYTYSGEPCCVRYKEASTLKKEE